MIPGRATIPSQCQWLLAFRDANGSGFVPEESPCPTTVVPSQDTGLLPRIARLRGMYWEKTHEALARWETVEGCGDSSLVGHARDFEALLDRGPAQIQSHELLAGVSLVRSNKDSTIDLGYYNRHYPPGHHNLMRLGFAGIRDRGSTNPPDRARRPRRRRRRRRSPGPAGRVRTRLTPSTDAAASQTLVAAPASARHTFAADAPLARARELAYPAGSPRRGRQGRGSPPGARCPRGRSRW